MTTRNVGLSVLIPAALLALITLSYLAQTASAEPRSKVTPMRGGFVGDTLPSEPTAKAGKPGPRAVVMDEPVLPSPPKKDKKATQDEPSVSEPNAGEPSERPRDKRLGLTIPKMGMKNVLVGSSPDQSYLDQEGIMHLSSSGFPWERGANTYIAGHAIGYPGGRVPFAFYDLEDMRRGDKVTLRDARGKAYHYRVYERLLVDPNDFWVTNPVADKDIVSLQTCWPNPSFEKRLIVRAERV